METTTDYMSFDNFRAFLQYLQVKKVKYLFIIALFLLAGMAFTFIQPLEYSSVASVLIIHKINPNLDAYTAARAAEKLSNNLTEIIHTTAFLDSLSASYGNDFDFNLAKTEKEKRRVWEKKVVANVIPNTSIVKITAYDKNPIQAEKLVFFVANTLITRGEEYHGGGKDIVIKLINKPLTSKYPTRPNTALNLAVSLIFGLLAGYLTMLKNFYRLKQHKLY